MSFNPDVPATLDSDVLTAEIHAMAEAANRGCGQVYELFVSRFSAAVDGRYDQEPEDIRTLALSIARDHGYATPAEIEEMNQALDEAGCCAHGLDPYNCPVGCGDLED